MDLLERVAEFAARSDFLRGVLTSFTVALLWSLAQIVFRYYRVRYSKSTPERITQLLEELDAARLTRASPIQFHAINNVNLIKLLGLGFFSIAGHNISKYSAWAQGYVPVLSVQAIDVAATLAFWLLSFLFFYRALRFWHFNRRYSDPELFRAYEARLTAAVESLKKRVVAREAPISAPEPEPVEPAEAASATKPAAAERIEKPGAGAERPAGAFAWHSGIVRQWPSGGHFGFIDGDEKFQEFKGGGQPYWSDRSRLVTTQAPSEQQQVMFLEHPTQFRPANKVAVLVCPIGGTGEGTVTSWPPGKRYCFASVKDSHGNSATVLVIPNKGGSVEWVKKDDQIEFEISYNRLGPIGRNPRPVQE
jgi:hypothetical protein